MPRTGLVWSIVLADRLAVQDGTTWSIIHRSRGFLYEAWYTVIPNERLPTRTKRDGTRGSPLREPSRLAPSSSAYSCFCVAIRVSVPFGRSGYYEGEPIRFYLSPLLRRPPWSRCTRIRIDRWTTGNTKGSSTSRSIKKVSSSHEKENIPCYRLALRRQLIRHEIFSNGNGIILSARRVCSSSGNSRGGAPRSHWRSSDSPFVEALLHSASNGEKMQWMGVEGKRTLGVTLHLCKTRVNVRFVGWISPT